MTAIERAMCCDFATKKPDFGLGKMSYMANRGTIQAYLKFDVVLCVLWNVQCLLKHGNAVISWKYYFNIIYCAASVWHKMRQLSCINATEHAEFGFCAPNFLVSWNWLDYFSFFFWVNSAFHLKIDTNWLSLWI